MTLFVNAMIYLLSSSYLSVNLMIRSHANSESATMTSRKLISSMSKSISESASMTFFINAMIHLLSLLDLSVNRSISRSHATSESASMIILSYIVSLLQETFDELIWINRKIDRKTNIKILRQCYELHYKS